MSANSSIFDGWTLVHSDAHGPRWYKYYRPKDRKGGDITEWPEDLRVREFPQSIIGNLQSAMEATP